MNSLPWPAAPFSAAVLLICSLVPLVSPQATFRPTVSPQQQRPPWSSGLPQGGYGRGTVVGGGRNQDIGDVGRDDTIPYNPLPDWRSESGGRNQPWDTNNNVIINEATYFAVASKMVRPGQVYRVVASIFHSSLPLAIRASVQRNGVELGADSKNVKEGIPEVLMIRVPPTSAHGEYKLRVEGLYDGLLGGVAFMNDSILTFSQRSMTIFIQLDKPIYMQGETVKFRTIPINTELKPFNDAIDVYILDPNRHIVRRWLSRQSNIGTVSLEYQLSDQPVFGEWYVQVIAQGQVEEASFLVEEYYQTRFEVNVTMPAFLLDSEKYIEGVVMANYTSGAPVHGNLTLKAIIKPVGNYIGNTRRFQRTEPRYYNFNEVLPFWFPEPDPEEEHNNVPHLKFFRGVYRFRFPLSVISEAVNRLDGTEVQVLATVGEHFMDEVIEGYSSVRIFNSSLKIAFLGGSPQVFKPSMPFQCYLAVSFHDGSVLPSERLREGRMEVRTEIISRNGGRRSLDVIEPPMSTDHEGIWELKIDLRSMMGLEESNHRTKEITKDIHTLRLSAYFKDGLGERVTAEMTAYAHYSPNDRQIKVYTSTKHAKVGEYAILHVQSNYYLESFDYLIISKGAVLQSGREGMQATVRTFALTLGPEMAPSTTVVVYHVGKYGHVAADSLTFPVDGISRNNFTVFVNDRKYRTGEKVEVAIYGEPGAYVGLSGIDRAFYSMQAGNELTYASVIRKMSNFGEEGNGTFEHKSFSHEGNPDEIVYFPSSTYGIDANRTFEYAGLVVFSDIPIPRRPSTCNLTIYMECLSGSCIRKEMKCDGKRDCEDGTDEAGCPNDDRSSLTEFRKFRFNRIQRQYENVWLWKDVNIGPHGRHIFTVDVPIRPTHWMVSAFGVSPTHGFGMIRKAIDYVGVLPFFINVEMPDECKQGEQVGIRVSVFNYMTADVEAVVILANSPQYKFVHVEMDGIVRSYNPRLSSGEHQFFVWIAAQEAAIIHVPIVPTRLGDIFVTITASSLLGKGTVTRKLHVEADGLPQLRHQSILLDLSNRAYIFQYMHVNVTETPIITYAEDRYYVYGSNRAFVSVVGDVVGPIFPTMPVNATSLLNLPMDSAEQNMFSFAANLYTTMYMRLIDQRNRSLERQSFHHMNIGYQRQLSFMAPDGSFTLFRSDWNQSASSVWLTAFCARIFQEASFYEWENFIYIDPEVISKAVRWVLKHQLQEGSFYETTWLPDRKMNSSLSWGPDDKVKHRNITLTAHVLIMLEMVKDLPGGLGSQVALAQGKAMKWLESNLNLLEKKGNAYEVALVSYALMISKSAYAEAAFGNLASHAREEGGLMYWARESVPLPPYKLENQKPFSLPRLPYKYDASNIEATSYALMTYVARQELMVDPIVKWLNAQRLTDGGWASTQDTAAAMKALIEYTVRSRLRDVSQLTISVEATALPGQVKTLHVTDSNLAQLQRIEIPEAWGTVKVQAKGAGYAILQMSVQYNVDIPRFQTDPPVPAFSLSTRPHFHGRNQSHITFRSCARWTNFEESERSGMAVLDVAIPTGYIIQQQDLDAYVTSKQVPLLQRARFLTKKVVFYFDYLDKHETCVNFTVERWHPVANMSRYLPIRVYDYYAPERFNETIFDSLSTYLLNICEVCGSSQCPYCPIYNGAVPSLRVLKEQSSFALILSLSIAFIWRSPHLFIL
ncbi:CD109 antigen [Hetaerina americana]|uniref:CD109 antigen n=1 Tax=Hetaerina americana TaxID=62018 RepID=UPI003A7F5E73